MTCSLGRLTAVAAATALLSPWLTGCGLLDGSSRIEEALEYLPADATGVTFLDRVAVAERLDLDDLETGASEKELDRWSEAMLEEGYGSELSPYARVMQEAAFSEFDIEWETSARSEDSLVRVWKLRDDVDFDAIAEDLEDAGYERSTEGDAETFTIEASEADGNAGLYGDRYPVFLANLGLVPDENLVVTGDVEKALDAITDEADSLADEGSFEHLLDRAPSQGDLEYAGLSIDPACGGRDASPAQEEQLAGDLGHPDGLALFAASDEDLAAVRLFSDDQGAKDDARGVESALEAAEQQTGFSADVDVEVDGDAVIGEAGFADRRQLTQAWFRGEGPFACSPE